MSFEVVRRGPRAAGPEMPDGRIELSEPPALGEAATAGTGSLLAFLPMGLGAGAMALMYTVGGGSTSTYLMTGVMSMSMMSMGLTQLGRAGGQRKGQLRAERRDYLRYLEQLRAQARQAAVKQRAAALWAHPDPQGLGSLVDGPRLWERRPSDDDFAVVRVGLGTRRAALEVAAPQTRPVEDLEPLTAVALRRFTAAYQTVGDLPLPVPLGRLSALEFAGDGRRARGLARAVITQLAVLHSPDEVRIALLADPDGCAEWDWLKWLPHNAHPSAYDAAGPLRLTAADPDTLLDLLGPDVSGRPDHDPEAPVRGPFVVVVADRVPVPEGSRLRGGIHGAVLLDLTGSMAGGPAAARLTVDANGGLEYPAGPGRTVHHAAGDFLSGAEAETVARLLAPKRPAAAVGLDRPLESDLELTTLLGVRDPHRFEPAAHWQARTPQHARLRVPVGVTADGGVVELDLKEPAQGGMGPHGMLIGATGSGKSELLRTLVIGLAATHSSEVLNFVLVDFKGGATFLNLDRLPHTSAVITNLAEKTHLVDRMRDAVRGELTRREELLSENGYASLFEYEKARLAGGELTALPSLLIVVDEFTELLASQPDFIDLFAYVGRVGRSLGVHLLLASQRLDESRISKVAGHLSYRIALRTFSGMESQAVIGTKIAHELPSAPGSGFLRVDSATLIRFKAAYVSGPLLAAVSPDVPAGHPAVGNEVVPFRLEQRPLAAIEAGAVPDAGTGQRRPPRAVPAEEDAGSLLELLVDRLEGAGPAARQVWLPPLDDPASLDQLLPGIVPDEGRGLVASGFAALGALRVPLGVVDKPFDQVRELLTADLAGAAGHVGVVGALQSGKSTLLRTLLLSLALTHTPRQVQFYCLDFGGGLRSVAHLPHVGSVATRLEGDRVRRTIEELFHLLEKREKSFADFALESMAAYRELRESGKADDDHGDVFLVIDGWFTLRQDFEDLEPRVTELAVRGLSYGIHVVVSAVRWSEIRSRLRDLLGTRLELRLGDAAESECDTRAARSVPTRPGRGLTPGAAHFLGALPRLDGSPRTDDLTKATASAVEDIEAFWSGPRAPEVRLLPHTLPVAKLPPPEGRVRLCLGLDERRLAPVWHDFDQVPNLLVFGDHQTGKTNALRLVLRAITARCDAREAKVLLADPHRKLLPSVPESYRCGFAIDAESLAGRVQEAVVSMQRRLPGTDIPPERLDRRDWWSGPRLFLVVDDLDFFVSGGQSPLAPLAPLLGHGRNIGLHLVVARSTSGGPRILVDPVVRRLWELGSPALLFSYPKEEGKFLGEARPRTLPAGRAQLVTRRSVGLIHTALAD